MSARARRTARMPAYAEDGGEEAEIAGIYIVAADGRPYRIGMAMGNEFSDHKFEKKNYLNLAGSKLRTCALGPELVLDPRIRSVPGVKSPSSAHGKMLWTKIFAPANPKCATACATSSIIISNLKLTAVPATFTSISSAQIASVSVITSACSTVMLCKSLPRVLAALYATPSA